MKFAQTRGGNVDGFDMDGLEIEYDYETDEEQITRAKQLLVYENLKAVDFFVTDDPATLVGNLEFQ